MHLSVPSISFVFIPVCRKSSPHLGVCVCVVNKQFELLEFVFNSVYVNLQYDHVSLIFTAGSVCLCCVCSRVVVLVCL